MKNKTTCVLFGLAIFMIGQKAHASAESTGPNGINSSGLGLTGNGVGIGQIENFRPGDPDLDTDAARFNSFINPKEVYFGTLDLLSGIQDFTPTANAVSNTGPIGHATLVAGIIISTDTTPIGAGTDSTVGVAPQADLYSSGIAPTPLSQEMLSRAAQLIANRNGGDIPAINVSTGYSLVGNEEPDGNSLFSSFIDWSARKHDVLYIAAGPYVTSAPATAALRIPADNFNGITVAFSRKNGNKFRQVDSRNVVIPSTGRTYIDLIAPGDENVFFAIEGNAIGSSFGTSIAAPHVTGTVALLQEHANNMGWGASARRHEVMKAVLMNSADKKAGILGSTRTVLDSNGNDWFDASNPAATNAAIPLHPEFGAGHLNAERALTQFSAGEFDANGADVPIIGWDYGLSTGVAGENRYALDQPLLEDSYLSVTLTWDRLVAFDNDTGITGAYDIDDTFETYDDLEDVMIDMDILLVRRGDDLQQDPIVAGSYGNVTFDGGYNLEHLFFQIPSTEQYDIVIEVVNNGVPINFAPQGFGIAWWGETDAITQLNGDFDNDTDADGADFLAWQRDTNIGNLSDWENDFGMTGGALAASNAVPEPATGLLLMMGLGFVTLSRPGCLPLE